jgi:hypothetical protein
LFLISNTQQAIFQANDSNIPEGIVIFPFLTSQQKGKRKNKLCVLFASSVTYALFPSPYVYQLNAAFGSPPPEDLTG